MMPQVFGTCLDSLLAAGRTVLAATGRTDDNPVIVDGSSGGSLPLGVTVSMQAASIAMAHVARNSFNRCVLLVNGGRRGLPVHLVPAGAIATGLGPAVKAAAELFRGPYPCQRRFRHSPSFWLGGLKTKRRFCLS
jgi:histidine ammonia-lyase